MTYEDWSLREKLEFVTYLEKNSIFDDWSKVAKFMIKNKINDRINAAQFFTAKSCAAKYERLTKPGGGQRNRRGIGPITSLRQLVVQFTSELFEQNKIAKQHQMQKYRKIRRELNTLMHGQLNIDQLRLMRDRVRTEDYEAGLSDDDPIYKEIRKQLDEMEWEGKGGLWGEEKTIGDRAGQDEDLSLSSLAVQDNSVESSNRPRSRRTDGKSLALKRHGASEPSSELLVKSSKFDVKSESPDSTKEEVLVHDYKQWKATILHALREISGHKHAGIFAQPVSDRDAHLYSKTVKIPMDLSKLKKQIENGQLRTTTEFKRRLVLTYSNAVMFNSTGHDVNLYAKEMARDTLSMLNELLDPNNGEKTPTGEKSRRSSGNTVTMNESTMHKQMMLCLYQTSKGIK